jgi:protein involved in polysaccharide export with SLBB domain
MKTGSLLMAAFLAPALFSPAQDKTPAAPETSKSPAAPAVTALAVPDSYVIGATDVIMVSVLKEPTLSNSLLSGQTA